MKALRELGVLHVEISKHIESEDKILLEAEYSKAHHAVNLLSTFKNTAKTEKSDLSITGKELCEKITALEKEKSECLKKMDTLRKNEILLQPWGDFSNRTLEDLKSGGLHIYLCAGTPEQLDAVPADAVCKVIKRDKHKVHFAVIAKTPLDESALPLADIPTQYSLSELNKEISKISERISDIESEMEKLSNSESHLKNYLKTLTEQIEFASHRDGMIKSGEIACINGYCPLPDIPKLEESAKKHGWGLLLSDPEESDNPPTLITMPKIFEASKPLFDFIGIAPGYREWDTSICFLIFFTIFFSMF